MRLNRSDYKVLRQAAEVVDAQKRLVEARDAGETAAFLTVGVTAGALLLFLTGALMQPLMATDGAQRMASEQIVWREGQERIIR